MSLYKIGLGFQQRKNRRGPAARCRRRRFDLGENHKMAKKIAVKTVLVCDDSTEIRMLLKSVLSNEGFAVLEAENGLVGQELAEAHIPDLIILDMIMPGQEGITTIGKLAGNPETAEIPIIIMTGKTAITKLIGAGASQVKAVFEKPFFMKDLRAKIAEIFSD
ncbi:MAG: hypothetical protein COZ15_05455 [Elusimicrobia bacterium CG_4_10_14_3_um_filter_49_12_50_7]|nr:MAG: hypothetical protein COS41_05775 [Elusimicrobia bacterium CG03_land_8_20_14_0_80_50_18]PIY16550.1 MAG: hypothetical protein COZ15_05455 [Elusimicrobia bacterium CG_4_10_14_3_um_filter_49_12_50_7]